MNTLHPLNRKTAVCVFAVLLASFPAHSQEVQHLPTLADCPPGYTLGVQDTANPMPVAKPQPDPNAYANAYPSDQDIAAAAQEQAAAPRQFITGCIPPQSQYRQ